MGERARHNLYIVRLGDVFYKYTIRDIIASKLKRDDVDDVVRSTIARCQKKHHGL